MNTHVRDDLKFLNPLDQTIAIPLIKTADQSVTSSTVLVDDTHLQFAIGASQAWTFELALATTGPGFLKLVFTAPTSAAGWWHMDRGVGGASFGTVSRKTTDAATFIDGESQETTATPDTARIGGYVLNSTSAGTFKLRWAQVASNGTATVVKKGSWLVAHRLA
jgi:hypothetical protein